MSTLKITSNVFVLVWETKVAASIKRLFARQLRHLNSRTLLLFNVQEWSAEAYFYIRIAYYNWYERTGWMLFKNRQGICIQYNFVSKRIKTMLGKNCKLFYIPLFLHPVNLFYCAATWITWMELQNCWHVELCPEVEGQVRYLKLNSVSFY